MPVKDMAAYMQTRRESRRQEMRDRLGGVCAVCGSKENLEFDHIDPTTKITQVSSVRLLDGPKEALIEETDKCQLLCRKHHVEKSSIEARQRMVHGRYHAAYTLACDCDPCKEFRKTYPSFRNRKRRVSGPSGRGEQGPRLPKGEFNHGTYSGYNKEKYEGVPPCDACKKANAEYARNRKEKKRRSGGLADNTG